jgi:hypothetical protein
MKKLLIFLFTTLFIVTGCGCNIVSTNTPKSEVQKLFSDYNSLSSDVLVQLDSVMASENLTDAQKDKYKDILKRQYEDLTYKIKDEVITNDTAVVTTEIEVYDLKSVITAANTYLDAHKEEFYTTGTQTVDTSKFWDYKLDKMEDATDRVTYTIDFSLTRVDGKWQLNDLLESDRQKIHGLYSV